MLKKLKSLVLDDTVYLGFLIILVGVGSFGLGKMSKTPDLPVAASVITTMSATDITKTNLLSPAKATSSGSEQIVKTLTAPLVQKYVGSKAGTKYHALTCPGAKQIKDTNKIFFSTEDEAKAAGYTRASNCGF